MHMSFNTGTWQTNFGRSHNPLHAQHNIHIHQKIEKKYTELTAISPKFIYRVGTSIIILLAIPTVSKAFFDSIVMVTLDFKFDG